MSPTWLVTLPLDSIIVYIIYYKPGNMNFLLNLLWHIPFCGFAFALTYFLIGIIMCCTVILIPVGKRYFQIALFLLAPFSHALVTEKERSMLTGENISPGVYTTILSILYLPFGCIAAIMGCAITVAECISIIGIPCGLVWGRLIKTFFNPFNKVCVTKAEALEIDRIKAETNYMSNSNDDKSVIDTVTESIKGFYKKNTTLCQYALMIFGAIFIIHNIKTSIEDIHQEEIRRIETNEQHRNRIGAYTAGDIHKEINERVLYIKHTKNHKKTHRHGLVFYHEEKISYKYNDAEAWCQSLGDGWRLPTQSELVRVRLNRKGLTTLSDYIIGGQYWTTTPGDSANSHMVISLLDLSEDESREDNHDWGARVLAVKEF